MKANLKLGNIFLLCFLLIVSWSCQNNKQENDIKTTSPQTDTVKQISAKAGAMSQEKREAMTPADVIQNFKDGNLRFINHDKTERDHSEFIRETASGQYPYAVVLSCLDSRIPVEDIFDKGIGDIFVARVAGNFVNTDILGSMEFACKVAGAKLILVMGHENCGAVKGAIDDVKLGNMTSMLSHIKPAIKMSQDYHGDKTSKDHGFVHEVAMNNVKYNIEAIRKGSPILKEMEEKGEIEIAGAFYDLETGKVEIMENL